MTVRTDERKNDIDKYNIKVGSPDSSNEYTIIVDFDNEIITGACFNYGLYDHMIDSKESIELLENLFEFHKPKREFSKILQKMKNK